MKTKYLFILFLIYLGIANYSFAQNYIWAKSLEGRGISSPSNLSPGTSNAEAIAVDSSGNIYIAGYSNDTVDFDPGPNEVLLKGGNDDIYIAKYDPDGNYLWAHVFWSPGWNYAKHIKIDKNGDIVIAGYATSFADFDPGPALGYLGNNATPNYIYIAKYDANGNYIWAKEMGNNFGAFIGSLDIDLNNNIFITGHFYGTIDMDPDSGISNLVSNQTGIFTAKYTQNGNYVWANCISGIGNLGESFSVKCSNLGNVYVAGIYGNNVDFDPGPNNVMLTANTTCDRFFLKYNNNGNLIWAKSFDVNEDGYLNSDRLIKMVLDNDENMYLTGNFNGTVDFNPGNGVFTINSPLTTSSYICKYNPSGQFLWAKGLIGGVIQTTDIVLDCQNNICLAGSFAAGDFDPSTNIYQFMSTASSAFNNFYAKYSSSGDFIWVKQIGNNGYGGSTLNASITLSSGTLLIAGGFKQTGYFNPNGTAPLQAKGVGQNSFFAKYQYLNTSNYFNDTTLCTGQKLLLDASFMTGNYLWQDGTSSPTYEVASGGNYWVDITSQNCKITDSVKVAYKSINPINSNDTIICEGTTITLSTNNQNAQFLWQDGTGLPSLEVNSAGYYWVSISDGQCSITDTIQVETKVCESYVSFPNVFTPNADGTNEFFVPIEMKGLNETKLFIYNRWGQKVFETSDLQKGWDGKIDKNNASTGVYYWIVNYATFDAQQSSITGFVNLMN